MKWFLTVFSLLVLAAAVRADYVQMQIAPTRVTWNDATGVMTVELTFQAANSNSTAVITFGSEMYLTGADGAAFTPRTGLTGASTATMVSAAGAAGYAWSTFDQPVISGTDPATPGSGGVIFDQSSMTQMAINSVAAGAVTAVYEFHYSGSHSAFTQVYAWVVSDDQHGPYNAGDPTSWAYLNYDNGAAGCAVQVTNEGVNLAPQTGTTKAYPVTGGTIQLSSSGPYVYGQVLAVTASAQPGYLFSGWSVTGPSTLSDATAASTSLTVYDDFTLTASFTQETLTVTVETSTTWVYQNTPSTTMDRHALVLTISATDTWGNNSYTVTVTQTGPGVVTPTQTQTNSSTTVLVTPTTSLTWTQAAAGSMTCYLVGGRVDGWVNSTANLNQTGNCTVTVTVLGDVSGVDNPAVSAPLTILVRPLGDILNEGPVNSLDANEFVSWLDGQRGDTSALDPEVFDVDGGGDNLSSLQLNILILMLNGHVIP